MKHTGAHVSDCCNVDWKVLLTVMNGCQRYFPVSSLANIKYATIRTA